MTERWAEPTRLDQGAGQDVLSDAVVSQWREQGFALVDGLLPKALIDEAATDARAGFPPPGSDDAERLNHFGSGTKFVFPTISHAANLMTLHPKIIGACAELLGVSPMELRLTQSDVWPKFGPRRAADLPQGAPSSKGAGDNQDQRIHVDYPNHTITHPSRWDEPEGVEMIVYFSDVDECGGATAVVPRRGRDDPAYPWPIVTTPGVGGLRYQNDRVSAEQYLEQEAPAFAALRRDHLYPREVRARYRPGTVLLYRHDTWHRGTPMQPGALRLAQNISYRRADAEWYGVIHAGWNWAMYRPDREMERLIAEGSTLQRTVLGFPPPGSRYWNVDTVAAVRARYAGVGEQGAGIDLSEVIAQLPT